MKVKAKFQHSVDGVLYKKGDYYRNCSEQKMNEAVELGLASYVLEKKKIKKVKPIKFKQDEGFVSD